MTEVAAFFDLDETIYNGKSMLDFATYYAERTNDPEFTEALWTFMSAYRGVNLPREEGNRRYYALFAGELVLPVMQAGRQWVAHRAAKADGPIFHEATVRKFEAHRAAGHRTVLVTGSSRACAEPLGSVLAVDDILCADQHAVNGWYTGTITRPVIGMGKAQVVHEYAQRAGIDLEQSYAYGDHPSDLHMLHSVGHPRVVGDDPLLCRYAAEHGWSRLQSTTSTELLGAI